MRIYIYIYGREREKNKKRDVNEKRLDQRSLLVLKVGSLRDTRFVASIMQIKQITLINIIIKPPLTFRPVSEAALFAAGCFAHLVSLGVPEGVRVSAKIRIWPNLYPTCESKQTIKIHQKYTFACATVCWTCLLWRTVLGERVGAPVAQKSQPCLKYTMLIKYMLL